MKLKKRYFLLMAVALLPFYKLIHPNDYCFGDEDLVIIAGLSTLVFIVFIVIVFNNLYGMSLGKELFNYRPYLIVGVFAVALIVVLNLHQENVFKTEKQTFKTSKKGSKHFEIKLFEDATFEFVSVFSNYKCVSKGTYFYKKDLLFLKRNNEMVTMADGDEVYVWNNITKLLTPKNSSLPTFLLQKK